MRMEDENMAVKKAEGPMSDEMLNLFETVTDKVTGIVVNRLKQDDVKELLKGLPNEAQSIIYQGIITEVISVFNVIVQNRAMEQYGEIMAAAKTLQQFAGGQQGPQMPQMMQQPGFRQQ
jgi:hypothetical protein